jgi:hypothetical protein
MRPGECKQGVCEIAVDILGRSENRTVLRDSKIDLKKSKIELPGVPNEGHDADDGRNEQQRIHGQVRGARQAAVECADIRRKFRRCVLDPPPVSRHDQHPQRQAEERVNIDPKNLSSFRPGVMHQPEGADPDDQEGGRPVKRNRGAPIGHRVIRRKRWPFSIQRSFGIQHLHPLAEPRYFVQQSECRMSPLDRTMTPRPAACTQCKSF